MKNMQKQWLKACNRVLGTVLVLLGFTACNDYLDDDDPGELILMYGVPSAQYNVKGRVIDADSQKEVPGIRVIPGLMYGGNGSEWFVFYPDTVYADTKGEFKTVLRNIPSGKLRIIWEDIDGAANGSYKKDSIDVDIKGELKKGDGSWNLGERNVNVTLKIKKISK